MEDCSNELISRRYYCADRVAITTKMGLNSESIFSRIDTKVGSKVVFAT